MLSKCHPLLSFPVRLLKQGFLLNLLYQVSPVSPSSHRRLDRADLTGLLAAAESARAGLLPGQTLPGQLRQSAEMLGDTALRSSGGLHTIELPGNK